MSYTVRKSENFTLLELSEGVYSAVSTVGGKGLSNVGIVDLGDRLLLFDSFLSPIAAAELKEAIECLTGKSVRHVVNSHYHIDHTGGNQVFTGCTDFISSVCTNDSMLTENVNMVGYYRENDVGMRNHFEQLLSGSVKGRESEQLREQLQYIDVLTDNSLDLLLPNIVFTDSIKINGIRNQVELSNYYDGHTKCDTVMYLPDIGILFCGDLVFVVRHPWLGSGNPFNLIQTLEKLKALDFETLVPGHGNIGSKSDIDLNLAYIKRIEQLAREVVKGNRKIESIDESCLEEPYRSWKGNKFVPNISFLVEKHREYLSK